MTVVRSPLSALRIALSGAVMTAVGVAVSASTVRSQIGIPPQWDGPYHWYSGVHEISHAGLVGKPGDFRGQVVFWRTWTTTGDPGFYLWNPAAPTGVGDAWDGTHRNELFCSGHTFDADGDLVIGGGDRNSMCDPQEPEWSTLWAPPIWYDLPWMLRPQVVGGTTGLEIGQYYPSLITMGSGQVIAVGGSTAPWNEGECGPPPPSGRNDSFQFFHKGAMQWTGLTVGTTQMAFTGLKTASNGTGVETFGIYPLLHWLSSGRVMASSVMGSGQLGTRRWSLTALLDTTVDPLALQWEILGGASNSSPVLKDAGGNTMDLYYPSGFLWPITIPATGTAQPVDTVVVLGGADLNGRTPPIPSSGWPASKLVHVMADPSGQNPAWTLPTGYSEMQKPRIYANAVLLPDMSVVVFGGSENDFGPYGQIAPTQTEVPSLPVLAPERLDLLNPSQGWQLMTANEIPRLYHSVALLLPDGRVFVGGGYKYQVVFDGQMYTRSLIPNYKDAEIFIPDYLRTTAPRPQIQSPPSTLTYGSPIQLTVTLAGTQQAASEIDYVALIRCGSVTHHHDWDQRMLRLEVQSAIGNQLTVVGVPSAEFAPPGYYMLFAVTKPGWQGSGHWIPSVAAFVKL